MFYVYEWFVVDSNEIIYVGKGTHNRYKAKKKNKFLNHLIKVLDCDVRIIAYYSTEAEAFEAERQRIVELKEIGQAICNKYIYKTGGVGYIWTDEKRAKMSENNPMKNPKQKERMSKFNPMKNPEVVKKVVLAKMKPIFIGEKTFTSQREAADFFGISQSTIFNWVKRGYNSKDEICGYMSIPQKNDSIIISKQELPDERIVYNGIEFKNAISVCKYTGIKDKRTIIRWCKKGFSPDGIPCRFKNDLSDYVYHRPNKAHPHGMKPITINGITYSSQTEACKILGCSRYILKKLELKYKQANQQPSQGNFDNSTLEGSTTRD